MWLFPCFTPDIADEILTRQDERSLASRLISLNRKHHSEVSSLETTPLPKDDMFNLFSTNHIDDLKDIAYAFPTTKIMFEGGRWMPFSAWKKKYRRFYDYISRHNEMNSFFRSASEQFPKNVVILSPHGIEIFNAWMMIEKYGLHHDSAYLKFPASDKN